MYTETEALNILLSTDTSMKPVTIDGKVLIRLFDRDGNMIHETSGNNSDQEALKWLVENKNAKTRVIGDTEAKDMRLSEVEKQLAETNARLAALAAASQPVTDGADEAPKPKRGKRSAEPDPAIVGGND